MASEPTTTSFALLGLLAIRDSTAYELTQQMQRALRFAWPRSEANIYGELKRLESLGLVTATKEQTGQRARTRYRITASGRSSLDGWLADGSPAAPRLEFETAVRLFFADQGEPADLRRTLRATRDHIRKWAPDGVTIVGEYERGAGPFPERFHLNMLFAGFVARFYELVDTWCQEVEAELDTWPSTKAVGETPGTRAAAEDALRYYRSVIEAG